MNQITIKINENETVFDELRDDWKRLFERSDVSPFLSWEWLSTWFKWFGANKKPFILKAFRGEELIGLLPLYYQEKRILGLRLKRLGFIGEEVGGADYLDLIARSEDKTEILAAIFDFLKGEKFFDLIALENLGKNSSTVALLEKFNRAETEKTLRYDVSTTAICPQIKLGIDWNSQLDQMPRAREFKRKLRKLEKMEGFQFRTTTSAAESEQAFERFIDFHEKRWQKKGGSEVTSHPQLLNFHRDVVGKMANAGLLRFEEIWIEGECRASVYGLEKNGVFYLYNTGFNQEWWKLSPGFVLIGHSIEQAIARGIEVYDFLRGDETYKFDWANAQTELVTVNLRRKTAAAFAHGEIDQLWQNLKNFSNAALPDNLAEKLKSYKRAWQRKNQLAESKT